MSAVSVFTLRKFSKYIFDPEEITRDESGGQRGRKNSWFHYPQRTNILITFYDSDKGTTLLIYHKGTRLEIVQLEEVFRSHFSFIAKYPAIGFKQIEPRGKTIKRFQLEFASMDEFNACYEYLKHKEFKIQVIDDNKNQGNSVILASQDTQRIRFESGQNDQNVSNSQFLGNSQNIHSFYDQNLQIGINLQLNVIPSTQNNDGLIMSMSQQSGQITSPLLTQMPTQSNNNFQTTERRPPHDLFNSLNELESQINQYTQEYQSSDGNQFIPSKSSTIPTDTSCVNNSTFLNDTSATNTTTTNTTPKRKSIRRKRQKVTEEEAWDLDDKQQCHKKISRLLRNKAFIKRVKKLDEILNEFSNT